MTQSKEQSNDKKPQLEGEQPFASEQSLPPSESVEDLGDQAASDENATAEILTIEEVKIQALSEEIERLQALTDEYLDGWQRARAEFANYRKRVERENEEKRTQISAEILVRYIDVLDDLERALNERPTESENEAWAEGIQLIHQKLRAILEVEGVEEILAEGEIFNPNFHEAISYEEDDDHEDGQVIEVIQKGYILGDRVLRPAMVRVAK